MSKPTLKRQEESKANFAKLSPKERRRMIKLLEIMTGKDKPYFANAVLVIYYGNEAIYNGKYTEDVLEIYNKALRQAVDNVVNKTTLQKELVFFCIYPDHSVSILGAVSA